MRRIAHIVALVAACGACDGSVPARSGRRIAVIPKGTTHVFWRAVHAGAERADRENADVEIVWKAPTGEGDVAAQIALLESFVADRYDGICLAPLDAHALAGTVRTAIARGVPVLIFDSPLDDDTIGVVSTVATDNRHGGELAAAELARRVGDRGDVVVLRYLVGSLSTQAREDGALAELAKHPDLRVVSHDLHAGPDEASAVATSERLLATFGERIDGIFCSNESTLSGFLTAVHRDPRERVKKIHVVGFDSSKRIADALRAGSLDATVVQDPVGMGHVAVATLRAHLNGEKPPVSIATKETLVTKEVVGEPAMQRLLDPLGQGP